MSFKRRKSAIAPHSWRFLQPPGTLKWRSSLSDCCMTSAVSSTVTHEQARLSQARSMRPQILRDLGGIALLAIASLAAGLVMNRYSPAPLPIVYQTPEQRFDAELTTLVAAPPSKYRACGNCRT